MFVVGSPRSGTTFLGRALGHLEGFVDAGELLAERLPRLYTLPPKQAVVEIRAGLEAAGYPPQGGVRPVIHTPEMAFLAPAVLAMDRNTVIVQLIRDCRDVVASLIEQGWFAARRSLPEGESAGESRGVEVPVPGDAPRYWTEPSRSREFGAVSEARRAAWLWRRSVLAGLSGVRDPTRTLTLRYEEACADPVLTAGRLAALVGAPTSHVEAALAPLRADSVGRWRTHLTSVQLEDVYREAGELLRFLGFTDLPSAFDPELAQIDLGPPGPGFVASLPG